MGEEVDGGRQPEVGQGSGHRVDERGKLLEDQFVLVDCEWWIVGGGFWIVDVL